VGEACATVVSHQVGRERWQHCVSSVFRHVVSLCFKCLDVVYVVMAMHACFKRVFQIFSYLCCKVFYLDVAKVHLDVAYVVMAIHACFKCLTCF
jgi:hypothetical protein